MVKECKRCHVRVLFVRFGKNSLMVIYWERAVLVPFIVLMPYLSWDMTKSTKWVCAQRKLRSAQSDQSSLSAPRKLWSLAMHWSHSEDSDQTGRMPRLIWVFAGRTLTLLVLTYRGSFGVCFPFPLGDVGRMWNPIIVYHCCLSHLVTKMACAPSKDPDQPGHPPSLIKVFAVRMKKAQVLS